MTKHVPRDERVIYELFHDRKNIWARFDIKKWEYVAYRSVDDAIMRKDPLPNVNANVILKHIDLFENDYYISNVTCKIILSV